MVVQCKSSFQHPQLISTAVTGKTTGRLKSNLQEGIIKMTMDVSQKILSDIIVFQKYAKYIPELNRREIWEELCERNMAMHIRKYPQIKEEIKAVYKEFVYTKKVLPSMRSMQFGGRPIELNNTRIFNCAYAPVDHPVIFAEAAELLLGGTGFGYSVQQHHVDKLPSITGTNTTKRKRFLVGDSIEGWADAIKVLVKAYTCNKTEPEFDYRDIRQKGSSLITAGGKAPGPDPLRICIEHLRSILRSAVGRKLTPIECHDMMCHIADAVLSGGIRRAAMIAFFSKEDMDMISCKAGAWWELNPQRGRANNSVVLERETIAEEEFKNIWKRIEESGSGEPGVYFTNDKEILSNPCVTGDALITVCDHGNTSENLMPAGVQYQIPLKLLVEQYETNNLPPMVLSYNIQTGKKEWDYLDAAWLTRKNADVIKLVLSDDTEIKVTPDHRVFTENRGWIEAKDLLESDILLKI